MMQAINLKKWQTQKLLRNLREKGYLRQIQHGGGKSNHVSYQIPLNAAGIITPEPMAPEQIAEQRAKYARKSKRVDQAADADEENQAPEQPPASSPESKAVDQARPFPAVAEALSTAIVPAPAPIPITPPPVPLTPEEEAERNRQEQIAGWQERAEYYQEQRERHMPNSRTWKWCDGKLAEALEALDEWRNQPVIFAPAPETAKGEYA